MLYWRVCIVDEVKFLIRLLFLFVSCYGYLQYLRRSIRLEFCIGLLFSGIGSILFLAGILNLLREATWCIWLLGLFLAGLSVKRKERAANLLSFGTIFFLALAVFFLFQLRGSKFLHYDNFSHWAVVSRIVTQQSRFPNYSDSNILFTSYPLGSAAFIFYITETLGARSEWMQMYAQTILITGMLVSLFAFAHNPIQTLTAAFCSVFLLCGNGRVFDLLVDCLLPVTALSATAMVIYYGRDFSRKLLLTVPYAIFLVGIKNSGVFFVIVLYCYLWITLRKENIPLKTWLVLLSAPALTLVLWQKHVDAMFYKGMLSKHSLSIAYFRFVFQYKSGADIQYIAAQMAKKVFSTSNRVLLALLFGLLIWLVWKYIMKASCEDMSKTLLLAVCAYVLYQIGTLGMYLFSMHGDEAMTLAGYSRYHHTIVLFVVGLILMETIQGISVMKETSLRNLVQIGTLLAVLVLSYYVIDPNFSSFHKQQLENTDRLKFDQLIEQYQIPSGADYLILTSEDRNDSGYLFFMSQYLLSSHTVAVQPGKDLNTIDLSQYNYIIVFEETEETAAFLSELSPDGAPVVCLD